MALFRIGLPAGILSLLALFGGGAQAQTIGLSFDDGFEPVSRPVSAQENQRVLSVLAQHKIRAMLFPAGFSMGSAAGMDLIRDWSAAGHHIGNHSYQHQAYSQTDPVSYQHDIEHAESLLRDLPGWCPRMRFPYLDEGNTPEKHNAMMQWLAQHGYGVAPATITLEDWNDNSAYETLQAAGNETAMHAYRQDYLNRVWSEIQKQGQHWPQVLGGRDPAHILLLHANSLNAAVLPDLIDRLQTSGWSIVDAAQALQDPIYQRSYQAAPAAGQPSGNAEQWLPNPDCQPGRAQR